MASDIRAVTYMGGASVTASDTVDDPKGPFAAIYVGTSSSGSVDMIAIDGTEITLKNAQAGRIYPIACRRIKTATTASDIIGLYSVNPPKVP